jgi:hypothetical protein
MRFKHGLVKSFLRFWTLKGVTRPNMNIFHAGINYNDLITCKARLINDYKYRQIINMCDFLQDTENQRNMYTKFHIFIMYE